MGSKQRSATTVKRRFAPQPLVIPADEVSYRPSEEWPPDIQEYLIAYARTGNRSGACRLLKRGTDWAYRQEKIYGDALTLAENDAYLSIAQRMEQTLQYRAEHEPGMAGVTSAIFLLKASDRERFSDRQELKHSGNVAVDWISMMRDGASDDETPS